MDDVLVHLRGIDTELKKDGQCEGDCQECLAGDCAPIASAMIPTARAACRHGKDAEELAALKALALELKAING
jgi:hypothetical protein